MNLISSPWKAINEINRWIILPYVKLIFAFYGIQWGANWRLYGVPIIQKYHPSIIKFGDGLNLRSTVKTNPLGANHPVVICTWQERAILEVGKNFGMTGGSICAAKHITIGNDVIVGANTTIIDTDFHPVNPEIRKNFPNYGNPAPVVIGDNVFIGMNCIILKGVHIGENSAIGAGSVVLKSIPSGVIAAGNPAKVIKSIY